jgi:hypothetical protein
VRQTVRALAEARREIAAARVSGARRDGEEDEEEEEEGREGGGPVGHVELLRYAKAIAKFTVPPSGFRAPEAAPAGGAEDVLATTEGARPGAGTPAAEKGGDAAAGRGVGWATLPEAQRAWLDQAARAPFAPWPAEETVRAGGLSAVQAMVEEGHDPAAADAAAPGVADGAEMEVDEREEVAPPPPPPPYDPDADA